jgi:hypothetical protein
VLLPARLYEQVPEVGEALVEVAPLLWNGDVAYAVLQIGALLELREQDGEGDRRRHTASSTS